MENQSVSNEELARRFHKRLREGDEGMFEIVANLREQATNVISHIEKGKRADALQEARQLHHNLECMEDGLSRNMAEYDDDQSNEE